MAKFFDGVSKSQNFVQYGHTGAGLGTGVSSHKKNFNFTTLEGRNLCKKYFTSLGS